MGDVRGSWLAPCALIAATLLAGCGSSTPLSGGRTPSRSTSVAAAATPPQTQAQTQAAEPPPPPKPLRNPYPQPHGPGPHPGANVARLIVKDFVKGRGPAVRDGDSVSMDYIEANYATGEVFLPLWGSRYTQNTPVNSYVFMRGLVKGIEGMRPGGLRVLIVPRRLSDVNDRDRAGRSYRQIVYWEIFLRAVIPQR